MDDSCLSRSKGRILLFVDVIVDVCQRCIDSAPAIHHSTFNFDTLASTLLTV